MKVDNHTNWGYSTVYVRHKKEVNVLWGDGHAASVMGSGSTVQQISQNITGTNGALKSANHANNCWTWDGKARPYGSWERP